MRISQIITPVLALVLLLLAPVSGMAQESDKDFLTRLLQDSLAEDGRDVQIVGFRGALSSEATIDAVTVADEKGIWLTLKDLTLQWNRSALLRGRIEIQTLSAKTITLARPPVAEDDGLPAPEAAAFELPEFPVSIQLDALKVDKITLGKPVLGEEMQLTLTAAAYLIDGDTGVDLSARRTDGKRGTFRIKGSFAESTEMLKIDLAFSEAAGGVAGRLLEIPDNPAIDLTVVGEGPLDDVTTKILLLTDGTERLAGQISLSAAEAGGGRRFSVDMGGDVTALFAPEYRRFFGADVALRASGLYAESGALDLSELSVKSQELQLKGALALNADQWPTLIDLTLDLAGEEQVLLPVGEPETRVRAATLAVGYSAAESNEWTARLSVTDLDRAGLTLGALRLQAGGVLEGEVGTLGRVTADVRLAAEGIGLADPSLAEAVGRDVVGNFQMAYTEGAPLELRGLDLRGAGARLTGAATVDTLESGLETTLAAGLNADDLARFSGLAGREVGGSAKLSLDGSVALGGAFDLTVKGTAEELTIDQPQADTLLRGRTELTVIAQRDETGLTLETIEIENEQMSMASSGWVRSEAADLTFAGRITEFAEIEPRLSGPATLHGRAERDRDGWRVGLTGAGPLGAKARIDGRLTGPGARIGFEARVPDIAPLAPGLSGAVALKGALMPTEDGWRVETGLSGPFGVTADVAGRVTGGPLALRYAARLPDIRPLVPAYSGPVTLNGTLDEVPDGWRVDATAVGPYGTTATAEGTIGDALRRVRYDARISDIHAFVPAYSGALALSGVLEDEGQGWRIETDLVGPYGMTGEVAGTISGDAPALRYAARLPDIRPLAPQISGPASAAGTVEKQGAAWRVNADLTGPEGTQATVAGSIAGADNMNLTAQGNVPLGLTEPFLRPRSLQGTATFDLALNGAPTLGALSGTVSTSGARFTAPDILTGLPGIDARAAISGGQADITVNSGVSSGGRISVSGPVTLAGAMPADLRISLANVVVTDSAIFRTDATGALNISGPLQGGAQISGALSLGETHITVAASGITSFGSLPPIKHVGASAPVRATQQRAGVSEAGGAANSDGAGPVYGLDIQVSAPSRIFVRGRGIDAELGGSLRLNGTTADVISAGRFDLVRGRLDILEKRFDLNEGIVLLQGDFDPHLRFVARTETGEGTASVIIEGPASSPEVDFTSVPEAPQDQVLAQIFFRRDLTQLSPFQAAQLASAVATLAGKGGEGIVGRLRKKIGVDDLDITSDDDGNTQLRVGKYISDNVYTDVTTTGGGGGGEVSLNIDLTPSITARGSVSSENESKLGIFYQKDY